MTRPSDALAQHHDKVIEILKEHEVDSAVIFGSVAAGTDTERSDLDIVVRFAERPRGLAYYGAFVKLEEHRARVLMIRVDVFDEGQLQSLTITGSTIDLM